MDLSEPKDEMIIGNTILDSIDFGHKTFCALVLLPDPHVTLGYLMPKFTADRRSYDDARRIGCWCAMLATFTSTRR